jgi:hypothetical protein
MNTDWELSRLRDEVGELHRKVRELESESEIRSTTFHFCVMMAGAFLLFYFAVKGS